MRTIIIETVNMTAEICFRVLQGSTCVKAKPALGKSCNFLGSKNHHRYCAYCVSTYMALKAYNLKVGSCKLDMCICQILMSASMDAGLFSSYFNGCPVVRVPGFTFPVRFLHRIV
jgi:hypothetical protein